MIFSLLRPTFLVSLGQNPGQKNFSLALLTFSACVVKIATQRDFVTAPPGGKRQNEHSYLENGTR